MFHAFVMKNDDGKYYFTPEGMDMVMANLQLIGQARVYHPDGHSMIVDGDTTMGELREFLNGNPVTEEGKNEVVIALDKAKADRMMPEVMLNYEAATFRFHA